MVTLADERVVLRPWDRSEAPFIVDASRDADIQRYNGPAARSLADATAAIDGFERSWEAFAVSGDPTGVAFAIVERATGELLGMCGVDHWWSTGGAQFGYWLAAAARGRGFATRAAVLMTNWLFDLGAVRVVVTIVSDNASSAAVARRAGFTYEGTRRRDEAGPAEEPDVDVYVARPDAR